MCSKSAQSFINKVRREGELHPAFSWDFCEVFVRISNKMHDIVEGQVLPCLSKIWSHFQFLGPHYIFYNIISRITLDLCSKHWVIAFGFRVPLIWNARCLCLKNLPHRITSVHRPRPSALWAMTFLLGRGYTISFWQAAVSYPCSLLIFPKGFLLR